MNWKNWGNWCKQNSDMPSNGLWWPGTGYHTCEQKWCLVYSLNVKFVYLYSIMTDYIIHAKRQLLRCWATPHYWLVVNKNQIKVKEEVQFFDIMQVMLNILVQCLPVFSNPDMVAIIYNFPETWWGGKGGMILLVK